MIRVFAGVAPNHEDIESQAVFEWSLKKHASEEVEVTWLKMEKEGPLSGWNSEKWATPFTAFRWAVPELCEYKGKAIYCDSDFIFFDDIASLYNQPILEPAIVLGLDAKRMCILLWDCERAKKYIPPLVSYRSDPDNNILIKKMFGEKPFLRASFSGNWNCLEGEGVELKAPDVQAVHYTSVPHQPHLNRARARLAKLGREHWYKGDVHVHPNVALRRIFDELLVEAKKHGYAFRRYTKDAPYGAYATRASEGLWIR